MKQPSFILFFLLLGCYEEKIQEEKIIEQKEEAGVNPVLYGPVCPMTSFRDFTNEECEEWRLDALESGCINQREKEILSEKNAIAVCVNGILATWTICPKIGAFKNDVCTSMVGTF